MFWPVPDCTNHLVMLNPYPVMPSPPAKTRPIRSLAGALMLAAALAFSVPHLDAQSTDRVALIEQVTSASCGPCASQNPGFNALLEDNADHVAIIKYQRGGGSYVDPMWSFNPSQVDNRIAGYYGTTSFPQAWINGAYNGTPGSINQSDIDAALSQPAWWDIQIEQQYNAATKELEVGVNFTALRDMMDAGDDALRAFIVVIEEEVNYTSPPGYNSESDFFWVMRRMLSGVDGEVLGQQSSGNITPLSYTYLVDTEEIDPARLRVVAFVQNRSTMDVAQAAVYREGSTTGIEAPEVLADFSLAPTVTDGLLTLSWKVLESRDARIGLYNAQGALVQELVNETLSPGAQQRSFVLDQLAPGTYHAVLQSGREQRMARFVVAR